MSLQYGSVCSGIEAATVAWHPLGWKPQFFSEIEAAPRAVLTHRWNEVPLHGDFTTIQDRQYGAIDLLVGGTPCQSFSVAGLRGGLADGRGNLALEYLRLAQRLGPRWLVWENVPGVLSSEGGRDFGAILGGMVELGYGFAYRVLDAQYVRVDGFGRAVPQRRRRVFVVGHLGDWRRAAAVLFERACLRGDLAPRRSAGTAVAALTANGVGTCGADDNQGQAGHLVAQATAPTLDANFGRLQGASGQDLNHGHGHLIAFGGNDTRGPIEVATAVNAHGGPCGRMDFESETFIAFFCKDNGRDATADGVTPTTRSMSGALPNGGGQMAIAFQERGREGGRSLEIGGEVAFALTAPNGGGRAQERNVAIGHNGGPSLWTVRRLSPLECERLQGFSDDYTAVPWRGGLLSDGPRYKALGNSMAVNCMRWIGRRIEAVDAMQSAPALMAAV